MRRLTLLLDFVKFPVYEKIVFFRKIINNVTDNPAFTNPDVSLRAANSLANQLEADYIVAKNGGKAATAAMHETEKKATEIFRSLADYVDRVAKGDKVIVLSSGFNLAKERAAINKAELSASSGEKSGVVRLKRRAVKGAKSYMWQYSINDIPLDDKGWIFAGVSTQASYQIEGLIPVSKYCFRSAVVTIAGLSDYCSPVFKVVE